MKLFFLQSDHLLLWFSRFPFWGCGHVKNLYRESKEALVEERASQLWKQEKRFAHVDHLNYTQSIRFSITATWNRDKPHGYGPCRAFHYSRVRNMKITLITCHILPMEKCLEDKKINENQEIHWLINRVCFLSMEKQLMSTYSYIYVFWYLRLFIWQWITF